MYSGDALASDQTHIHCRTSVIQLSIATLSASWTLPVFGVRRMSECMHVGVVC